MPSASGGRGVPQSSNLRDTPGHPGCRHIGGGRASIVATDSTNVLARIGNSLALIDAAAEKQVWSRRSRHGAIHTHMGGGRIALVYPEQAIILDRATGSTLQRFMTPMAGSQKPKIDRITTAQGRGHVLAVGGGTAVHVFDIRNGRDLSAFRLSHPVRSMAVLTNAVLTLSQSTEHHGRWRADLHAIPSGKALAGQDLECRRSWETPPTAIGSPKHGVLAAFAEGRILHYETGRSGPALRTVPATSSAHLEEIRANADMVTLVHRTNEKQKGGATETAAVNVRTGESAFKQPGTWSFWPDLSVGTLHRTRVHKDRVGAEHTAYLVTDRSGSLTCRGADGNVVWKRSLPMAYESSRGWWRKDGHLLELVVRDQWAKVFGNYAEDVWEEMFQRWPGGEPDRAFPALDVRTNGARDLALRRIDLKTGGITMLGALPGAVAGPRGRQTAVMCAGRLVYATDQGLFLVSDPATRRRASGRTDPEQIPYVDRAVRIDGLLEDWKGIADAEFGTVRRHAIAGKQGTTRTPRVKLVWDDMRLCIAVSVPGSRGRPAAPGASLWDGDGVLVAIDPEADGEARFGRRIGREQDNDILVCAAPTADGARLTQFHGLNVSDPRERVEDRAQVAMTSDDRGTTYEIALPLSALLVNRRERLDEGSRLGLGLAVLDTTDGIRILEFGAGIVDGLSAAGLRRFELVNTSAEKSRYIDTLKRMLRDHPATPHPPKRKPMLSQHVYLDPSEPPQAIALVFRSSSGGFSHGAYWADSPEACGGFVRPRFVHMGRLPSRGEWHRLRMPAEAVRIPDHELLNVGWAVKDGKAWWDRTTWVVTNNPAPRSTAMRYLVEKNPSGDPVFTGSGFGKWVDDPPGGRKDVHAPGQSGGWCFYYGVTTNALVPIRKDRFKTRTPAQWLEACGKVVTALEGNRMLATFLRESEQLPLSSKQLALLYREAIEAHPDSSWTYRLLTRLLILESDHAVVRRRYTLWLDKAVGYGSPAKSNYKPLKMSLVRIGRRWQPDVPARTPTFNTSNHSGVIQDLTTPVTNIPIMMNIGYDPWVPGDKNSPYRLSLYVEKNGVVYGSYVRTFRKHTLASGLSGRCVADYVVTEEDGASESALKDLKTVRRFARKARVSRRQRHLFERALTHPADPSGL